MLLYLLMQPNVKYEIKLFLKVRKGHFFIKVATGFYV